MTGIRLSYDDFCRLTLQEFNHIYKAYRDQTDAEYRDKWERMRMLAALLIQPHVKKPIKPQKLLPLAWDKVSVDTKPQTKEERKARFEALMKRIKL